tara:strand:+ start:470 stop:835 length:366 start_codon:yes stop_codon:yes gene_type:complete
MKKLILLLLISFGAQAQTYEPADTGAMAPPTPDLPAIYVYIPDFITPNGDGINDDFDLSLEPTYKVELKLYSRWGNLVYQSDDYQNNFPALDLADGVYALSLRVYDRGRYKDYYKMITIIK